MVSLEAGWCESYKFALLQYCVGSSGPLALTYTLWVQLVPIWPAPQQRAGEAESVCALSPPGDFPNPGIEAASPALASGFITASTAWQALLSL